MIIFIRNKLNSFPFNSKIYICYNSFVFQATGLRRNARDERVLFHYNGHGVPKPTGNVRF